MIRTSIIIVYEWKQTLQLDKVYINMLQSNRGLKYMLSHKNPKKYCTIFITNWSPNYTYVLIYRYRRIVQNNLKAILNTLRKLLMANK